MKSHLLELLYNFFLHNTELRKVKITMYCFSWGNNIGLFETMIKRFVLGPFLPLHYDLEQKGQQVPFHHICRRVALCYLEWFCVCSS